MLVVDKSAEFTEPGCITSQLPMSFSAVLSKATSCKETQRNVIARNLANKAHSLNVDIACNLATTSKTNQKNEVTAVNTSKATSPCEKKINTQSNDETDWITVGKNRSTRKNKKKL